MEEKKDLVHTVIYQHCFFLVKIFFSIAFFFSGLNNSKIPFTTFFWITPYQCEFRPNPKASVNCNLLVLVVYVGRRLLLGITQIEKGSTFGLKTDAAAKKQS